jgi:ribosomal protein S18 acetylase RimI-like enzyme
LSGKNCLKDYDMKNDAVNIIYTQTGAESLDEIAPLWLKLREHHKERSLHFKDQMKQMTWEKRKSGLVDKSQKGEILIDMARDKDTLVGYCVSTVSENGIGEVESLYIDKEYRRCGIGDHFMKTALKWMDNRNVTGKIIGVAVGNEEVFGFYSRYGFYPRVSILRQVDKK